MENRNGRRIAELLTDKERAVVEENVGIYTTFETRALRRLQEALNRHDAEGVRNADRAAKVFRSELIECHCILAADDGLRSGLQTQDATTMLPKAA